MGRSIAAVEHRLRIERSRRLVSFDVAALLAFEILQYTACAIERIAQRDVHVHVSFMLGAFAADG